MATTKASFNFKKNLFMANYSNNDNRPGHNWLDKNVVNKMINNFNDKEILQKRS